MHPQRGHAARHGAGGPPWDEMLGGHGGCHALRVSPNQGIGVGWLHLLACCFWDVKHLLEAALKLWCRHYASHDVSDVSVSFDTVMHALTRPKLETAPQTHGMVIAEGPCTYIACRHVM